LAIAQKQHTGAVDSGGAATITNHDTVATAWLQCDCLPLSYSTYTLLETKLQLGTAFGILQVLGYNTSCYAFN